MPLVYYEETLGHYYFTVSQIAGNHYSLCRTDRISQQKGQVEVLSKKSEPISRTENVSSVEMCDKHLNFKYGCHHLYLQ